MEDWLWKMLPVAVLVVQGLFVWSMWSLRRNFMTCDACQGHRVGYDKRLADAEGEGQALRASLDNLPTAKDLHEVVKEVAAVGGGMEAARESVKALGISIDRLDRQIQLLLEHHINGDRS